MPPQIIRQKFSSSKLLKAWVASGGTEDEFYRRNPAPLNAYEEDKLEAAGIKLDTSREFFMRLKVLLGENDFAEFAGELADRQRSMEMKGSEYTGLKPNNPTAVAIGLGLHRLENRGQPQLALAPSGLPRLAVPPAFALTPADAAQGKASAKAAELVTSANGAGEMVLGFTSRVLVACNLPHSDPGDIPFWSRSNGSDTLIITPGRIGSGKGNQTISLGFPYGMMPRLISIYFATEAIRTKNKEIVLGDSFNEFIRRIGIQKSGPNARMVREQLHRLINANIKFTRGAPRGSNLGGSAGLNGGLADAWNLWWDARADEAPMLFQSVVKLNGAFFDEVVAHGFPVDLRAIADIKKSPLALDLYGWMAYRVVSLKRPLTLTNEVLQQQLGTNYKSNKDFARELRRAIARIKVSWPKLRCEPQRGGMLLSPCEPPIPPDRSALK